MTKDSTKSLFEKTKTKSEWKQKTSQLKNFHHNPIMVQMKQLISTDIIPKKITSDNKLSDREIS